MMNRLHFAHGSVSNEHWDMYLEPKTLSSSDLVLKSVNNTLITFTDDFEPELLNFTGKHRCSYEEHDVKRICPGLIVRSIGKYLDLDDKDMIKIDEAIPIVRLSRKAYDSRVFGVVCNIEEANDKTRSFRIGNMQFRHNKKVINSKVVVNSHGEGGIWVCDIGGPLKQGDLICSSTIPGLGMKQSIPSKSHVMSYTVGKITCDCSFKLDSKVYKCERFRYKGKTYKKAFVGCVYKI